MIILLRAVVQYDNTTMLAHVYFAAFAPLYIAHSK